MTVYQPFNKGSQLPNDSIHPFLQNSLKEEKIVEKVFKKDSLIEEKDIFLSNDENVIDSQSSSNYHDEDNEDE